MDDREAARPGGAPAPVGLAGLDVVRRLARVSSQIAVGSSLGETLQAVADGIVDVLGFGVACVNHRNAAGDFVAVAVAGDGDARRALTGTVAPAAEMHEVLRDSERWGSLRFTPHDRAVPVDRDWVPDIPVTDDPEDWHPEDMLLAPMYDDHGQMVGVLCVDLPPGGRRPSQLLRELLELFAMQAGIAIAAVELRERLLHERAAREELLLQLATRDPLTGLPNRRALDDALTAAVAAARATGEPGAVLFCDVDGLKQLNDRHGHVRGDRALRAWADELVRRVRPDDVVARLGGDEFVVVADGLGRDAAAVLARAIRSEHAGRPDLAGLTVSVGIAVVDGSLPPDTVLELADEAMYVDKARRRRTRLAV